MLVLLGGVVAHARQAGDGARPAASLGASPPRAGVRVGRTRDLLRYPTDPVGIVQPDTTDCLENPLRREIYSPRLCPECVPHPLARFGAATRKPSPLRDCKAIGCTLVSCSTTWHWSPKRNTTPRERRRRIDEYAMGASTKREWRKPASPIVRALRTTRSIGARKYLLIVFLA